MIAAVVRSAHLAHRSNDRLPGSQITVWRLDDLAGALDPYHPRERDRVAGPTAAGDQLRAVQTKRSDADENPSRTRDRDRTVLEREHVRAAGFVNDNRSHGNAT